MSALNIQNLLKETILVGITDHSLQTLAGLSIISLGILLAGFLVYKLVNVIIVSWINQIFRHSRYIFLNAIADAHLINIISIFIFVRFYLVYHLEVYLLSLLYLQTHKSLHLK